MQGASNVIFPGCNFYEHLPAHFTEGARQLAPLKKLKIPNWPKLLEAEQGCQLAFCAQHTVL